MNKDLSYKELAALWEKAINRPKFFHILTDRQVVTGSLVKLRKANAITDTTRVWMDYIEETILERKEEDD